MSIKKPNEESQLGSYLKIAPALLTTVGVLVGAIQYNSNYEK